MRLIASLLATWIVAITLGAVWAGYDVTNAADAQVDDPYVIAI